MQAKILNATGTTAVKCGSGITYVSLFEAHTEVAGSTLATGDSVVLLPAEGRSDGTG